MLITGLPASSALNQARADDLAYAEAVAALPPPEKTSPPRLSEWTAEREHLAQITDRIGELTMLVLTLGGGKPRRAPQVPRPETEIDRARERAADRRHDALVDDVKAAQRRWRAKQAATSGVATGLPQRSRSDGKGGQTR